MKVETQNPVNTGAKPVLLMAALAIALTTIPAPEANAGDRYSKMGRAVSGKIYEGAARRIPGCGFKCGKVANRAGGRAFDAGSGITNYVGKHSRKAGSNLRNKYLKNKKRSKRCKRSRRCRR